MMESRQASNIKEESKTITGKNYKSKEERKILLKQRRQEKKAEKQVGFRNEILNETQYFFENGFRKVYPYYFGWNTTAKERWFGMTLFELYTKEFQRAIINQSIEKLIQDGKIRVNGQIKEPFYKIKNGDRISHLKHRHEIPVLADKIKVVHEDQDYIVVDKPCSIPIHPCGKFRYNTLSVIMVKEMGYTNLRTIYRIDRLTSGLVIFGKNFKATHLIDQHIKNRTASKTYLCRVSGEFPWENILVDKPIDCASPKLGLHWINENGKHATTEFEKVSFNGKTSLLKCYPKTGRTHQIRIHLQFLGFPIVNDPLYNQPNIWGEKNGKDGIYPFSKEEIEQNFLKIHSYEAWIIDEENTKINDTIKDFHEENNSSTSDNSNDILENQDFEKRKNKDSEENFSRKKFKTESTEKTKNLINNISKYSNPSKSEVFDNDCFECKNSFRDPQRDEIIMFLHAFRYKFDELEFQTDSPNWASDSYQD